MQKIHYQADFTFILDLTDKAGRPMPFPSNDFRILVETTGNVVYSAGQTGGKPFNCANENGKIKVVVDNPGFAPGTLSITYTEHVPDSSYPDGMNTITFRKVLDIALVTTGYDVPTDLSAALQLPAIRFRYEDFTAEQLASLQKPATDAANAANAKMEQFARAEGIRDRNEKVRVDAETLRAREFQTAQSNRENAFNAAQDARAKAFDTAQNERAQTFNASEQARATAETGRAEAEKQRNTNEAGRADAETARKNAETGRQTRFEAMATDLQTANNNYTKIETTVNGMIANGNALVSDVANGKKLIADAITAKGVITLEGDSYEQMAQNIGQIKKMQMDDAFTVEIDDTIDSPEVKRTGGPNFPDALEAQIRGAILAADGSERHQLNHDDFTRYADGTNSVTDGSNGDVMIWLPEFYFNPIRTSVGTKYAYTFKRQTSAGWRRSPGMWVSPTNMVIDTTGGGMVGRSCYNTSPEFRGGTNVAAWDTLPKSLLGMPRTSLSLAEYRGAARSKGETPNGQWHNYDYNLYAKILLMFMAVYGTRDVQAPWSGIDPATGKERRNADGYKYGGLGGNVMGPSAWHTYNGNNPFLPCNLSYQLGCRSGVVQHTINEGTADAPALKVLDVPVLWGCVGLWGYLWQQTDGITFERALNASGQEVYRIGMYTDPSTYVSQGMDGSTKVVEVPATFNTGFIKRMNEDLLPLAVGANAATNWCDQWWLPGSKGQYCWLQGGSFGDGGGTGLASAVSYDDVVFRLSDAGGRLSFTPREAWAATDARA